MKSLATPDIMNVPLILVRSESGQFGERGNPDYATRQSCMGSFAVGVRMTLGQVFKGGREVAVAPEPGNTPVFQEECSQNPRQLWLDAQATTATAQTVPEDAVAKGLSSLPARPLAEVSWDRFPTLMGESKARLCGQRMRLR